MRSRGPVGGKIIGRAVRGAPRSIVNSTPPVTVDVKSSPAVTQVAAPYRAGQAVAKANGKRWGGSVKGRRCKVTSEQVDVVRRLHNEDTSIAGIACATGLSRPTVYAIIESEVSSA